MKTLFRRAAAICLALTLLTALVPGALGSWALGSELHRAVNALGPGVSLTTQRLWSASKSDLRTERYLTYTPTAGIQPVVVGGETLWSKGTLTAFARSLEGSGGRVLGGANGDYFVMATGEPLGSWVTDGVLRAGSPYYYAVGFRADGTAMVGKPGLTCWADFHGYHLIAGGGYNKTQRDGEGYAIFSPEFGAVTSRNAPGVDVVLRPTALIPSAWAQARQEGADDPAGPEDPVETEGPEDPGETEAPGEEPPPPPAPLNVPARLTIGGKAMCVVEAVLEGGVNVNIPPGRFVLSVGGGNSEFLVEELRSLQPGEGVTLSVQAAEPRWEEAVSLIGAFERLVEGGQALAGLETAAAPRTAAGVRADGTLVLYTIDGRQAGYSVGAGADQVARRLVELGCVDGVLFDGGGSTALGATGVLEERFALKSSPSGGSQRAVTNALFFVSYLSPSGRGDSLYITPQDGVLLSGTPVELGCYLVDDNGFSMGEAPGAVYTLQGPGTLTGSTLTGGRPGGTVTVTAALEVADEPDEPKEPDEPGETEEEGEETPPALRQVTGSATFTIVDTPSAVIVSGEADGQRVTALNLEPGEAVELTARSVWYNLPVASRDEDYVWTLSPEVGTVDGAGRLTAGYAAGTGTLTVTAGGRSAALPVTVGGHVNTLSPCEELTDFAPDTAQLTLTGAERYVKTGRRSIRVDYPLEGPSTFACDLPVLPGEVVLGAWLYGDGGELTLTALLELDDGTAAEAVFPAQSFTGWAQRYAAIPANTVRLTGFVLTPGEGAGGTLYLDRLVTGNTPTYDVQPPEVAVTVAAGTVRAVLTDDVDRAFAPQQVAVTLDGAPIPFTLSGGSVTASLEGAAEGQLHRVTVTAADAWGNLARGSAELAPAEVGEPPFADMAGHWAEGYIRYLYDQGVTVGSPEGDRLVFRPGSDITRGEFAVMVARWLRVDAGAYEGEPLPFVDADAIPSWARNEVGALYALGVFNGSLEADGLRAKPGDPISRAEAMTMLGRVQARGYGRSEELFLDHADIPAWAEGHIYTLVEQGVVNGYNGLVRPRDPVTRAEVAKLLASMW